jgi:alpha-1,3-rhamnosyl/mannosyltransferase
VRIGIDARKAADYGIGTYICSLTAHLVRQYPSCRWFLFHRPGDEGLLPDGENVTLVPERAGTYTIRELIALSLRSRQCRLDLFHAPHYTLPLRLPCPSVVTVHDLIHLLFREYLPHPLARHYARYMIGRAVREAAGVITVSWSTEGDIRKHFPEARSRISVIPNGVEQTFSPRPLPEVREWLSHSLDMKGAYLLFVGNPKKHKNLDLLMRAFARIHSSYPGLELVVVGGGREQHSELSDRARALGIHSRTRLFGNVDRETLALLYSAASVFVFPSLYEGFGLPPLEAMSCGAPVAASSSSSIPEVLGPAAAYFSPENVDSLMTALCDLLDHPGKRERLARLGKKRSRLFSWEEAARQTMVLYREAAGRVS